MENDQPIWLTFIVAFILMNVLLVGMAYMTWFERKVIAAYAGPLGPTRTGPHGLLQPLADGIKLLGKEDLIPGAADKRVFYFAPLIIFVTAIVGAARDSVRRGQIHLFGRDINLFVTDVNVGALYHPRVQLARRLRHHPWRVRLGESLFAAWAVSAPLPRSFRMRSSWVCRWSGSSS